MKSNLLLRITRDSDPKGKDSHPNSNIIENCFHLRSSDSKQFCINKTCITFKRSNSILWNERFDSVVTSFIEAAPKKLHVMRWDMIEKRALNFGLISGVAKPLKFISY